MRLKSRIHFPPRGFSLTLPEIGMAKPINGSFNTIVDAFGLIVSKNPALAQKHGWPTSREDQENWVDLRECQRLLAHGWTKFVEMEGTMPPPGPPPLGGPNRRPNAGGAAEKVSQALTGAAIYADMFRGSKPVAAEESEWRAAICEPCPMNKRGGFKQWFVEGIAKGLTELVGIMNAQKLTTTRDKELGTCDACGCPVAAKVHVELSVIREHMPTADIAKLHPLCWITK